MEIQEPGKQSGVQDAQFAAGLATLILFGVCGVVAWFAKQSINRFVSNNITADLTPRHTFLFAWSIAMLAVAITAMLCDTAYAIFAKNKGRSKKPQTKTWRSVLIMQAGLEWLTWYGFAAAMALFMLSVLPFH